MKKIILSLFTFMAVTMAMAQQVGHTVHTIERGETLESIAQKYHVSVDAIKKANPDAANMFYVGMKIDIPKSNGTEVLQQIDYNTNVNQSDYKAPAISKASIDAPKFETELFAGASFNTYTGGDIKNVDMQIGFNGGVIGRYYIANNFFAEASLMFTTKGYKAKKNSDNKMTTYNIDVPINVGYRFVLSDGISLKIKAGPYITYALNGEQKADNVKTKLKDIKSFNTFNVGIDGGIAFEFHHIVLSGTYQHGLATLINKKKVYEQNIFVSLGYRF